jgi:hypothetical protein
MNTSKAYGSAAPNSPDPDAGSGRVRKIIWESGRGTGRPTGIHAREVSLPGVGHNDMLNSGGRLCNFRQDFLKSSAGIGP